MPKQVQPDTSGNLVTAIGGTAIAVGNDTVATVSVENTIHDNGHTSIAKGDTFAQASAASTNSSPGADAITFLFVSGADHIVVHERNGHTQDASDASAVSILRYVAIDHPGNAPHGPKVVYAQHSDNGHSQDGQTGAGNIASVTAAAVAHGDDTAVATSSTAITVENQFSFVSAAAIVAV